MTCLTGGLTPCSAATGIPGRPDTSSSPTCRARAAPTKAFPGTPWSSARQTAAAQPGTARDTTRPTRRPPAPLGSQAGSQAGSHHHPTQGDPEPNEAFDTSAVTGHSATVADGSRQTGSRSHRGSELATASHSQVAEVRTLHIRALMLCSALPCLLDPYHRPSSSASGTSARPARPSPSVSRRGAMPVSWREMGSCPVVAGGPSRVSRAITQATRRAGREVTAFLFAVDYQYR
jgi:hypothetical protein